MLSPLDDRTLQTLIDDVTELREAALGNAATHAAELALVDIAHRGSAENLLHYLALRQRDLRPLQLELSHLGLSSLGRLEAHADATLRAVLSALYRLGDIPEPSGISLPGKKEFEKGSDLLRTHADQILGTPEPGRHTRIMVTMPALAADDPDLIPRLLSAGMNLMRINCAHDSGEIWMRMVNRLREAEKSSGRTCRIAFDLAGPKWRTGTITPAPPVFRWKPVRDHFGRTLQPARVRFIPAQASGTVRDPMKAEDQPDPEFGLPVALPGFELLQPGRYLRFSDTRGRRLELEIVATADNGEILAECNHTGYIAPGTVLEVIEGSHHFGNVSIACFRPVENSITLSPGEPLILKRGHKPGYPPERDETGRIISPAFISCDFAPLFTSCRPGESIFFDDGLISGVIREVLPDEIRIDIIQTAKHPARLKAEKGINLPETCLQVPALTGKDINDLACVLGYADMISLSFVRSPDDVSALIAELDRFDAEKVGIVLKIETRSAFENLPAILLAALRHPPVAVMIARGDLGVELGFERLAEVQEEILWICEAAHVPVIWATQVLESLAKRGFATRAEVTDAAMSSRAECVMLNKGPYIVEALETLSDILVRMQHHQSKKSSQMRPLSIAGAKSRELKTGDS